MDVVAGIDVVDDVHECQFFDSSVGGRNSRDLQFSVCFLIAASFSSLRPVSTAFGKKDLEHGLLFLFQVEANRIDIK